MVRTASVVRAGKQMVPRRTTGWWS